MSDEVQIDDKQCDTQDNETLPTNTQNPLPVDVDGALDWWHSYQRLTEELLDESDYQGGKDGFKKKSAWRKYGTAFQITIKKVSKEILRDDDGRVITAEWEVEAIAPNGRKMPGYGACSMWDKAHEYDKVDKNGRVTCKGPCNGRKHFDKPEHDIPSTAYTRAVNRAIADMIGAGEVSAEEIDFTKGTQKAGQPKAKTIKTRQRPGSGVNLKDKMKSQKPKETTPQGIDPDTVQDAETTPTKEEGDYDWKALGKKSPALKKVLDVLSRGGFDIEENTVYVEACSMNNNKLLTDRELDEVEVILGRKPA